MLSNLSKSKVHDIANLAEQYFYKEDEIGREHGLSDHISYPEDSDRMWNTFWETKNTPEFEEIKKALTSLTQEELSELCALMWIGRGDYSISDWELAVKDASSIVGDGSWSYMLGKKPFPRYLRNGLNRIYSGG